MSQAKVDRYKEEKRNRAQIIKKQKREWLAVKASLSLVALVMVAWVGFSVYRVMNPADTTTPVDKPTYTVDTAAIDDFMDTLDLEEE